MEAQKACHLFWRVERSIHLLDFTLQYCIVL
jgi:hypothetical protein